MTNTIMTEKAFTVSFIPVKIQMASDKIEQKGLVFYLQVSE